MMDGSNMCSCGEREVIPNLLVLIKPDSQDPIPEVARYCNSCLEALIADAKHETQLAAVRLIAIINYGG